MQKYNLQKKPSRRNQNNLISVESTYVLQYLKNYQKMDVNNYSM